MADERVWQASDLSSQQAEMQKSSNNSKLHTNTDTFTYPDKSPYAQPTDNYHDYLFVVVVIVHLRSFKTATAHSNIEQLMILHVTRDSG